ncbi:MAG: DUF4129 domain-containing protein, partial [Burkholderiales bacterium]
AHAWAEVWLEGRGWVRIDPTSAVAPERIERGASGRNAFGAAREGREGAASDLLRRWRLSIDAVAHGWNQWVLSYDRTRQQTLLARFGLDATDPRELAGALAGTLAIGLALVALATLRPRGPRDPVENAYLRFCDRLGAIGAPRAPDETASRYLHRVDRLLAPPDAALARDIVATYNRLRYDPETVTPERVRDLRRLVDAFKP